MVQFMVICASIKCDVMLSTAWERDFPKEDTRPLLMNLMT